jgi:hypothetical protein
MTHQEDRIILNTSITSNEIETVINNLPTKKSPGVDGFIAEFYETFNEQLMLLKLFHKLQKKGIITNLFYEATINLILKKSKAFKKKKVIGQYP